MNLLNNSKQAIRQRGIIEITLFEHAADWLGIHVADNGSGIPAEEQPNIFERYFRGENKKLHVRGLGLGLTFSRMLATAMKGSLTLQSSSQQGTTFQLLLPRALDIQKE